MPVTHVTRYRDTYYLHVGRTKTGKPRYWFSTKADGDLVDRSPKATRSMRTRTQGSTSARSRRRS